MSTSDLIWAVQEIGKEMYYTGVGDERQDTVRSVSDAKQLAADALRDAVPKEPEGV